MSLSTACIPIRSLAFADSISFAIFTAFAASSLLNSSSFTARSTSSAMFLAAIDDCALYSLLEDGLLLTCVAGIFYFVGVLLGFALRFSGWSVDDDAVDGVAFVAVGFAGAVVGGAAAADGLAGAFDGLDGADDGLGCLPLIRNLFSAGSA